MATVAGPDAVRAAPGRRRRRPAAGPLRLPVRRLLHRPVPPVQHRADLLRHLSGLHRVGHRRCAHLGGPRQLPGGVGRRLGRQRLPQHAALRPDHRAGRHGAGAPVRAVRPPALAAGDTGAHPVLHPERRLGHRDRPGLGLAARHPVRPGQPVSGGCSASGRALADLERLVAGRRLDRLDLVGPGPGLRPLPGGAPGRAARPARGGRHRRRRAAAAVLARDPAAAAAGDQHGRDPAADRVLAHLQPSLRHDQRRARTAPRSRSSTMSTRWRSSSTGWATPRPSRCCCSR